MIFHVKMFSTQKLQKKPVLITSNHANAEASQLNHSHIIKQIQHRIIESLEECHAIRVGQTVKWHISGMRMLADQTSQKWWMTECSYCNNRRLMSESRQNAQQTWSTSEIIQDQVEFKVFRITHHLPESIRV